jgi:hypothetical protein
MAGIGRGGSRPIDSKTKLDADPRGQLTSNVPTRSRMIGILSRSIFVCALLILTVRVSAPQSERIWSVYETFGDLVRVVLGLIVCVWLLFHLFRTPKDADEYRTWTYLGLALASLGLVCVFAAR